MTLLQILAFAGLGLVSVLILPASWRRWVWFITCLLAIYWLQPSTPIRNLDFWFPTLAVLLTILSWAATQNSAPPSNNSWVALFLAGAGVAFIGLTRYLEPLCCLTPTRPPPFWQIGIFLIISGALTLLILYRFPRRPWLLDGLSVLLILFFILIKSPILGQAVSAGLRIETGQPVELASALDLRWLGYSYLAFRLIHTLRDARTGRLPALALDEYLTYSLFWSTYTAGPIDRLTHFSTDLRQALNQQMSLVIDPRNPIWSGIWRITWGIFKKFALADTLALIALNETNASQVVSTGWMWLLLYAFSLRIYLDFSGYTDIAIGLGSLVGLKLPENFDRPYFKPNLTAFWNSWHITLAQWFRAYFFNPFTRTLRSKAGNLPTWLVIWLTQVCTMGLIGLWHGITWNFLIWGVWHGFGLFIHNRWLDWQRSRGSSSPTPGWREKLARTTGWFLTFHYVTLSWVWFALPTPQIARLVFSRLLGL